VADNLYASEIVNSRVALLERVSLLSEQALSLLDLDEENALECAYEAYNLCGSIEDCREIGLANFSLGSVLHRVGSDEALKYFECAFEIFTKFYDGVNLQKTAQSIGYYLLNVGRYNEAEKKLEYSLAMARHINVPAQVYSVLNLLAGVYHYNGSYEKSTSALLEVIEGYENEGNILGVSKISCNLGTILTSSGKYEEALYFLSKSYNMLKNEVIDDRILGICLNSLGQLYYEMEDYEKSLYFLNNAIENCRKRSDKIGETIATLNIAILYKSQKNFFTARKNFISSLELANSTQNTGASLSALSGLAEILIQENEGPEALENLLNALPIAEELQDLETQLEILNLLGQAYALTGQWPEAEQSLQRGLELVQQVGRPKAVLDAHRALYEHFKQRGDLERALHHFEQFYQSERALLTEESDKRVRELSAKFDLERAQQETQLERLLRATAEDARNAALEQVAERTLELEQAQIEIVSRLALAAEFRDDITGEHTLRVGRYSAAIAQRMGLDPLEVALIEQAARLHDVGKIGIPDSILLKPGKLTSAEYEFMKAHTTMGGRILSGGHSRLVKMAETIALSHHERWDGQGYPGRLRGEDIPLEGRIVAIADVFDALRQGRPYKTAWTKVDAWTELLSQSGKQFDPSIIEIFGRLLEDGVDEVSVLPK